MNYNHSWQWMLHLFQKICGEVKRKKHFGWGESALPSSWGVLSTLEVCRPGINSSQGVCCSSEGRSGRNIHRLCSLVCTLEEGDAHTHTTFTRLFVLCFELFCRELSKVVIIKRVPRRLRGGIHISARRKSGHSSLALVRSRISDI